MLTNTGDSNEYLIENKVPVSVALLIIAGLYIVGSFTVSMYQTYTNNNQIMAVIDSATKNNRQLEFYSDNSSSGNFNVTKGSQIIGMSGKNRVN